MRVIHGEEVHGSVVDGQTRCTHFGSNLDIIAIKFRCCERWYPCRECHDEGESHQTQLWPHSEFGSNAILCGACGDQLSIEDYLRCGNKCPSCQGNFNPGCSRHYHLYFEVGDRY